MLRFFDKEVVCVYREELDGDMIRNFFMHADQNEIVCVLSRTEQFEGLISYYSLVNCIHIEEAILPFCLELNRQIWQNARDYIRRYKNVSIEEHIIIPIVDHEKKLLCFAYDDVEANREIRMLRELSELSEAYQFTDIYPNYKCVKIYECNELAFYFAEYLRMLSLDVVVFGEMWNGFFENVECCSLDFQCFDVWAEGHNGKSEHWVDNERRSAAAYFECIDEIYEKNIAWGGGSECKIFKGRFSQLYKKERIHCNYGYGYRSS